MKSIVIDLPKAIEHARALARSEHLDDVVEYRAGDIREADLGTANDVALLANIMHHFQPAQNIALLKRVRASMSSDGTIAIWDLETPAPESTPNAGDGAALYFRLTSTALCYSVKQYSEWLLDAGFERIRTLRPRFRPGYILVVGRVSL
jgi:hypothetical protein